MGTGRLQVKVGDVVLFGRYNSVGDEAYPQLMVMDRSELHEWPMEIVDKMCRHAHRLPGLVAAVYSSVWSMWETDVCTSCFAIVGRFHEGDHAPSWWVDVQATTNTTQPPDIVGERGDLLQGED